jgi:hypothetical protein
MSLGLKMIAMIRTKKPLVRRTSRNLSISLHTQFFPNTISLHTQFFPNTNSKDILLNRMLARTLNQLWKKCSLIDKMKIFGRYSF